MAHAGSLNFYVIMPARMYRFTIRRLFVITLFCGLALAFVVGSPHLRIVALFMSNDDIVINSASGKIETTGATSLISSLGFLARETLVQQLDNPNKFAAAHVALTENESPFSSFQLKIVTDANNQSCNGMPFKLNETELHFYIGEQPPLKQWWREYLRAKEARKGMVCSGILLLGGLDFSSFDDEL